MLALEEANKKLESALDVDELDELSSLIQKINIAQPGEGVLVADKDNPFTGIDDKHTHGRKKTWIVGDSADREETPVDLRKRMKVRKKLSLQDKMRIVYQVVMLGHQQKDVAREHRVTSAYVSFLIKKAKKNPKYFSELAAE